MKALILVAVLSLFPRIAAAQGDGVALTNPLGTSDVRVIIGRVIQAALGLSGSIALLMIIYGGFLWLTSGGNTEKIEQGKKILIWAVLGLVVLFSAYTITNAIIQGITTGNTSGGSESAAAPTTTDPCDTNGDGTIDAEEFGLCTDL